MPKNTPNIHVIYKTHEFEKKEKFINTIQQIQERYWLYLKKNLLL